MKELGLRNHRTRWQRGRLYHGHLLACRSHGTSKFLFSVQRPSVNETKASMAKAHLHEYPHLGEMRRNAFSYFENLLMFANHLGMFSEEVNHSGEQMGNTPQAFSHISCISAAMNLKRS